MDTLRHTFRIAKTPNYVVLRLNARWGCLLYKAMIVTEHNVVVAIILIIPQRTFTQDALMYLLKRK